MSRSLIIVALSLTGLTVLNLSPANRADASELTVQANEVTQSFAVENMTCPACPLTVKKAMARVEGVKSVIVDFDAKTATAVFDSTVTTAQEIADGEEITATNRAHITATADANSDDGYVIEEIVVIGRKKSRKSYLDNSADTYPVMQPPSWTDWQFLPRYDPEQAGRYFDLIQLDEEIRRAGFIELFRLSFGR